MYNTPPCTHTYQIGLDKPRYRPNNITGKYEHNKRTSDQVVACNEGGSTDNFGKRSTNKYYASS